MLRMCRIDLLAVIDAAKVRDLKEEGAAQLARPAIILEAFLSRGVPSCDWSRQFAGVSVATRRRGHTFGTAV